MPTLVAESFMSDIIQAESLPSVELDESLKSSSALDNISASELVKATLFLFGESSLMQAASNGSTAQCSEMNPHIKAQTLSDRLTPLLISAGLVCGIIPMSMRLKSNQTTLDFVSSKRDGETAASPKVD